MIPVKINILERGATPRKMAKAMTAASKSAWFDAAVDFHATKSDLRFTHRHATEAGYAPRSKNYLRRKLSKFGHTNPLEFSGTARRLSRTARITTTSKGATVRYPGLRVFNFRNPKMRANMAQEFTKVLPQEANDVARVFDRSLDRGLSAFNESTSTSL